MVDLHLFRKRSNISRCFMLSKSECTSATWASGAVVNSLRECSAVVFSLHPGSNRWWVERKHVFLYLRHSEFFLFSVSNRTTRSFGECVEDFKELRHCILSNFRHSEFSQSTVQF